MRRRDATSTATSNDNGNSPGTKPIDRRSFLTGAALLASATALGCMPERKMNMSEIRHRPLQSLPATTLPWLSIHDHFIATVGANSGRGSRLGPLLVLADATFAPHSRFPIHPHKDMEILTVVVDGEVSHHGDQAHDAVVKARGAQLISARNGMVHAEGNDTDNQTRMLQIWFEPNQRGGEAAYFDRQLPAESGRHLIAGDEAMPLRCDARIEWIDLLPGHDEWVRLEPGRSGYLLGLKGQVQIGDTLLGEGEGANVTAGDLPLRADGQAAVLWIDVAI